VTQQAAPILTELDQRGMGDLLYFVENWALALKGRDALGHFVGAELNIDPAVIQSALDSFVNNSGLGPLKKSASGKTANGGVHASQPASAPAPSTAPSSAGHPSVQSTTTPASSGAQGSAPTSPAPTSAAPPSPAPGLPPNTIQKLLNFLLGP
jgi:hypothetical protein